MEEVKGSIPFSSTPRCVDVHRRPPKSTNSRRELDCSGLAARYILNLNVDDCHAVEAHLESLDVIWIRPVEDMAFGVIGTVADPEGNYVQVIQWAAPAEDHKS